MSQRWLFQLGLLFIGVFHYEMRGATPDYWWSKWSVLLALIIVWLGARLVKEVTLSAGLAFAYTALSSLYVFAWRDNYVRTFSDSITASNAEINAAYALVAFLLVSFFFLSLELDELDKIREAMGLLCLADSMATITGAIAGGGAPNTVGGFFDEYSINACFIGVTLPFAIELFSRHSSQRNFLAIPALALVLTAVIGHTRSPFVVTLTVLSALILQRKEAALRRLPLLLSVSALTIGLYAACFHGDPAKLWGSSGRAPMVRAVFEWLFANRPGYWFFGTGNGSFSTFGPGIQKLAGYQAVSGGWFLWLHSDWLQIVPELGLAGLLLYAWLAIDCVRGAWGDRYLFASLVTFMVTSLFQYPVHLALFAFLGAYLVRASLFWSGKKIG